MATTKKATAKKATTKHGPRNVKPEATRALRQLGHNFFVIRTALKEQKNAAARAAVKESRAQLAQLEAAI